MGCQNQQSLSRNGNGQKIYFLRYLDDGYYEAESVFRSFRAHRVYFEVRDHSVVRVLESKNELKAELQKEAVAVANEA